MPEVDAANAGPSAVDEVVTCFLRHRGEVLLVRRSGRVGTYRGRWGAVSGFAEGDPLEAAWREIAEETGLQGAVTLVKRGEPFAFDDPDEGRRWRVHPFLFDASSRDARLDWEAEEGVWVAPPEILLRSTVPRLWTSYERAGPTVADLRADREHGSAWLSLRAVEVLRDRAAALAAGGAEGGGPEGARTGGEDADGSLARAEVTRLARALAGARPAMIALPNRVHRAMARALGGAASGGAATAVRDAAGTVLREAIAAEGAVAEAVARAAAGRTVMTLSLSGTVQDGLLSADPAPALVVVCESRPGAEGRTLAARLVEAGVNAVLVPDAAVAWALGAEGVDLLLVGADTVYEDGSVVNKVGTRPAALAARAAGVRVLAAASTDKIAATGAAWTGEDEEGDAREADASGTDPWGTDASEADASGARGSGALGSGARGSGARGSGAAARTRAPGAPRALRRRAPLFEWTPGELIDAVLTERGELTPERVAAVAAEHAADRAWLRRTDPGSDPDGP